jgi:hypothetical protein
MVITQNDATSKYAKVHTTEEIGDDAEKKNNDVTTTRSRERAGRAEDLRRAATHTCFRSTPLFKLHINHSIPFARQGISRPLSYIVF